MGSHGIFAAMSIITGNLVTYKTLRLTMATAYHIWRGESTYKHNEIVVD
jgi:hypothetical protein